MQALEQIGIENVIIPIGKDREPIWPEGIVGSISHCDSLAGAIVSRKENHISLGLDIEEIGRVTDDLWPYVFTDREIEYLNTLPDEQKELSSTVIFSLKEAFYKFQFPITKVFLDFLDVEVQIPELNRMVVLSGLIPPSSLIHNNKLIVQNYENTVIAVVLSE
jgi:4'-phosphopantetheinyl transferase EntD